MRRRMIDTIILTIITISPIVVILIITKTDPFLEYIAKVNPEIWMNIMAPIGILFGMILTFAYITLLLIYSEYRHRNTNRR